jgi:hypothetical protein
LGDRVRGQNAPFFECLGFMIDFFFFCFEALANFFTGRSQNHPKSAWGKKKSQNRRKKEE